LLETELKAFARSIGVAHLGIAPAGDFEEVAALLRSQERDGTYPHFAERDIDLRTRPTKVLPSAKSLIAIAVPYLSPAKAHPMCGDVPRGIVSRYAWGRDYHSVLKEKIDAIARFLAARVDFPLQFRSSVDTGPLVDRAVAVQAGIGWFGKNACVYVPGAGSWVFLGEMVTNVPLRPDPPVSRSCGTCDKCVRACPTGAIERPFWINPHKCLSYITQMPGMIPKEFRRPMGRRLWGCDICQAVCPWNWEAEPQGAPEFEPDPELGVRPALIPLLTMTNSQFRKWFGPTAMGWRGKKIIQRNACICLGNIKDPRAVPPLADRLFTDARPVIRASAAWALGEIGGDEARSSLERALKTESDEMVLGEIRDALFELSRNPG